MHENYLPTRIIMSFIKINQLDNVAVALRDYAAGELVAADQLFSEPFTLREAVAKGHKIALCELKHGQIIIKYGMPMGIATQIILRTQWIHTHNVKTQLSNCVAYHYEPHDLSDDLLRLKSTYTSCAYNPQIAVYRRSNGAIGIRNELWIVPTVGCVNAIAKRVQADFLRENQNLKIDGVHVFTHPYGCSQLGEDHQNTKTILQNMVLHPNAGAVLVMGLGCENNQISAFKEGLKSMEGFNEQRVRFMSCQFEQDENLVALDHLDDLYKIIQTDMRSEGHLGELKFGLECGGSDGLSGITANPLLGCFSDTLIYHGGTTVLTEVPEMFGAEQVLMNRAVNIETFDKLVNMINGFKQYFIDHNQPIYENPSPGNKAGGISTLEEKSLGCTQKAGINQVMDVLPYGARLQKTGLNLLSAPGNDAVATTALAASGCHMVLFSTGRGTPYGGFVPTIKISTNSALAKLKPHWIDFNAGTLLEGTSMDVLLLDFMEQLASFASGKLSCNEKLDFRELAIFKSGVTL